MSPWFSKTLLMMKTESWNWTKIFLKYSELLNNKKTGIIFLIRGKLIIHSLLKQELEWSSLFSLQPYFLSWQGHNFCFVTSFGIIYYIIWNQCRKQNCQLAMWQNRHPHCREICCIWSYLFDTGKQTKKKLANWGCPRKMASSSGQNVPGSSGD